MDTYREKIPYLPEKISGLADLAYNLWWSWHPEARMLFKILHRPAWKLSNHNPVRMLHDLDDAVFEAALNDPKFMRHYDAVMSRFQNEISSKGGWYSEYIDNMQSLPIAFFSIEYGLHHSLPFYAGGLGFLAGDFLKECSDLGIPIVGIGFMYPQGYLRQRIKPDGWQVSADIQLERENAPITRVFDATGNRLVVKVPIIEPSIFVEVWKVQIGKVSLYLIDTDIDANDPWNRGITSQLYVGSHELRLRQEIVLGIGGSEVLRTLGILCPVIHLNEGHTAFAILERIRQQVAGGMSFTDAFETVRSCCIFTTHTPVPAGHDIFAFSLIERYFTSYWDYLGISREDFFRLGAHPVDPNAGFNMTAFALRASAFHNGVSKKHGQVTRKMWQSLWPDSPEEQIPIDHVTNGVHVPTWTEPKIHLLYNKYLGPDWLASHDDPHIWELIEDIPDEELWKTHYWLKMKLILKIMESARQMWIKESPDLHIILASGVLLDPNILTIGFARRFATYKRATLLLQDRQRLKRIVNDRWRPVQFIFAGKAHPDDDWGKKLIQEIFNVAKDPAFGGRIAFVEDYDEQMAQYLVHGADVWLNNPQPPYEACGTSGMKASLNGVPQLSILDGWWIEAFNGRNGWAFGSQDDTSHDRQDAEQLYTLIENELITRYYQVDEQGISHEWVRVMKDAIKSTAAFFSSRRMSKEYAQKYYQDALKAKSVKESHT